MYLENLIKYNRNFAEDHDVDVTLLYNYNYANTEVLTANSNTFPSDILNYYSLSLGENQTTDAGYSDYRAIAMMARINYKFKNRYLLTLTGRRDGASAFSENHKFAFFPSMALGWIMTDESFLVNNSVFDFLKIISHTERMETKESTVTSHLAGLSPPAATTICLGGKLLLVLQRIPWAIRILNGRPPMPVT